MPDILAGLILALLALACVWRVWRPFPRGVEDLLGGDEETPGEGG